MWIVVTPSHDEYNKYELSEPRPAGLVVYSWMHKLRGL